MQEPSVSLVEAKMGRRLEGSVIKCNDPRGINTGSHWLDSNIFDLDSWTQIQRKQSVVLESRHASQHLSAAGRLKLHLLTASKRSFSILQRSCTWTQGRGRINSYLRNLCWMWFQFGHVLLKTHTDDLHTVHIWIYTGYHHSLNWANLANLGPVSPCSGLTPLPLAWGNWLPMRLLKSYQPPMQWFHHLQRQKTCTSFCLSEWKNPCPTKIP